MSGEAEIITSIAGFLNAGAVIILYWLMSRSNSNTESKSEKFKGDALESLGGIVLALISRVNIGEYFKDKEENKLETLPRPVISKDEELDLMDFMKGMIEASIESLEKTRPKLDEGENIEGSVKTNTDLVDTPKKYDPATGAQPIEQLKTKSIMDIEPSGRERNDGAYLSKPLP